MDATRALAAGAVGAVVLNLVHESARQVVPEAPQVQKLGMRAVSRAARWTGNRVPGRDQLYAMAMAGDLASNAAYYSLVGLGDARGAWTRGALLGLAAGVGAVVLPGPMGLGSRPVNRTPATAAMTVAWYTLGGLAAAAAYRYMDGSARGR